MRVRAKTTKVWNNNEHSRASEAPLADVIKIMISTRREWWLAGWCASEASAQTICFLTLA